MITLSIWVVLVQSANCFTSSVGSVNCSDYQTLASSHLLRLKLPLPRAVTVRIVLLVASLGNIMASKNLFSHFGDALLHGVLPNSLNNWAHLVSNKFWIVLDSLYPLANWISYPLFWFPLTGIFQWLLFLSLSCLFEVERGVVCVLTLQESFICTLLPLPLCTVPPSLPLFLDSWHTLWYGLCWALLQCCWMLLNHSTRNMPSCSAPCFWFAWLACITVCCKIHVTGVVCEHCFFLSCNVI